MLFSFSGIVVEELRCGYRFLTSASLVRALKEHDDLKVGAVNHHLLILPFDVRYS